MRKVLISLAAAAATLAVAAPASAQSWGNNGPGYGYGNGYGYNNAGYLQRELQQIRVQADRLARSGRLTRAESRDLFGDIRNAERAVYRAGYNGVSPWEARSLQQQMQRLRYEIRRYADYDGRRGYNRDRDHDRDWDRDRDHDGDRDHDRDWDRDRDHDRR
jgi:hypothetical protein